jgi:hypothetical protein
VDRGMERKRKGIKWKKREEEREEMKEVKRKDGEKRK